MTNSRLLSIAAAAVCMAFGLSLASRCARGEIVLKYEVDREALKLAFPGLADEPIDVGNLLRAIRDRLESLGKVKGLDNGQVEVRLKKDYDEAELRSIKRRISAWGNVEFRMIADPARVEDRHIVEIARQLPPGERKVVEGNKTVAEWVRYLEKAFGPVDLQDDRTVKRVYQGVPEMLVLVDSSHVTGEYMRSATKIVPEEGPAVLALSFNREGSLLLDKIAGDGGPPPSEETPRYLGLLLDGQLIGGCSIRGPVGKDIPISGQTMNEDEVDSLISVFNAGLLPYPLREVTNPAAE